MSVADPLSLVEIAALETPTEVDGTGGLLAARTALDDRWNAGLRDLGTCRRRAFLWWWACAEPEFLTGLPEDVYGSPEFLETEAYLIDASRIDSETRFVLGWMNTVFAYCFRPEAESLLLGERLLREFRAGEWLSPSVFSLDGEYDYYFAQMLERENRERASAGR
jgi:hypothetical protein